VHWARPAVAAGKESTWNSGAAKTSETKSKSEARPEACRAARNALLDLIRARPSL
jgi:hypothetical protein